MIESTYDFEWLSHEDRGFESRSGYICIHAGTGKPLLAWQTIRHRSEYSGLTQTLCFADPRNAYETASELILKESEQNQRKRSVKDEDVVDILVSSSSSVTTEVSLA
jgi:hypothetical protein